MTMNLWLWDPGRFCGVAEDRRRAVRAASACLLDNSADSGRVESAAIFLNPDLDVVYTHTGDGWTADRRPDGSLSWVPFGGTSVLKESPCSA